MSNKNIFFVVTVALFIAIGCKTAVTVVDYRQSAETAEEAGDYVIATEAWKAYFEQLPAGSEPEGSVYAQAAQTAYQAADVNQALKWFDQAIHSGYEDHSMYLTLAQIYRHQGNISKELTAIQEFRERSPEANPDVNARLFSIYYTTNQPEKAMEAWSEVPDTQKRTEQFLDRYFTLNKQLGNDATADSVSIELLKIAPEHVDALEWQAQKNYEKGEERYQREMKNYQDRPTTGNYQTLLRGLKAASVDFRKALEYFEKLWEVNPDDRQEYAVYMNNIHVRFNDKEKADYYRKFIN